MSRASRIRVGGWRTVVAIVPALLTAVVLLTGLAPVTDAMAAQKADMVRVVKSKKRLYLIREDEVFATYRVKFGADPKGHKVQQGDEKTPEGLYYLTYKNSTSRSTSPTQMPRTRSTPASSALIPGVTS
jgi:L,D-peptidoglycan transpeptidase YkuD (ErfK/YbiS/YcfS/YnhG family)